MLPEFLYRALRKDEIEMDYTIFPKSDEEFISDARFGVDMVFPISFGSTTNAVRQHNWKGNGFPTRGNSTTPNFDIAAKYAHRNRVIVKIDTSKLALHKIEAHRVNKLDYGIAHPEDDEYILVYPINGGLPKDIIIEIIKI